MMPEIEISPAEKASIECIDKVYDAIDANRNFLVEAGAGAGKTYTLIKALKRLIAKFDKEYQKSGKRIACITYTNVAKDEIRSRTDNHPIILADTIHAFAWEVMQGFQKAMRERMSTLGDNWVARIEEAGGVQQQRVIYSLGYPKITEKEIFLHHNDVIKLFTSLMYDEKFFRIFSNKYPILLIDEYQDTNRQLAEAFVTNFIEPQKGSMIGFFGDHWQKIYGSDSCGLITASEDKLMVIGKQANFRSDKNIVAMLNRMRPELQQHEFDPASNGDLFVFHTNNWAGERRTGAQWNGDLPEETAHDFLVQTKENLNAKGWNISSENTKVLMLTNNVLASEQGYQNVAKAFSDNDDYIKKNDDYISFLIDVVELGAEAFDNKKYGAMIQAFKINTDRIRRHSDKQVWHDCMIQLNALRQNGTVGEVIDLLKVTHKPKLSKRMEEKERRFFEIMQTPQDERSVEDQRFFARIEVIRAIPFSEIQSLAKYIDDKTLYSTKHGVKGAEFENVIVVLGRGWNHYNWSQFLELVDSGNVPAARQDAFERNRNLFYVACSRPKKRLCLLITQQLSPSALRALGDWFGDVVQEINIQAYDA
jgi:DNA helicase-2/ATP-dependent DNA helicase PcrA